MSSHDSSEPEENLPSERKDAEHGAEVEPAGSNPFADPGMPPHEHRAQDIDAQAASRSERTVALLFLVSMIATVGFIASFVAFPVDKYIYVFPIGHISALNFSLGLTLAVALFALGAGAVHWARTLMSDVEVVDYRHPVQTAPEKKAQVLADLADGAAESGFGRRKLARNTLFGALSVIPLAGVVLLRDLGPLPEKKLRSTAWAKGKRLMNYNTMQALRPEDIVVGSLTFAMPDGMSEEDHDFQQKITKASLMLIRLQPGDIKDKRELDWSHEGIVAFSKVCTHVGCPINLYEQQTHHVLCPCHQSTFDLADGGRVIFGPAGHALPQLRISVNNEGYLEAMGDFAEPVGPAFWERG